MPIPFATLSSEDVGLWNLQLHFWRNAVEHFEQIRHYASTQGYDSCDPVFGVDASMVIVLAGTSVSQLLGQQWEDGRLRCPNDNQEKVPPVRHLFARLVEGSDLAEYGFPEDLKERFDEFINVYDSVRHFGEPKHETVLGINQYDLCRYMALVQVVWRLTATLLNYDLALLKYDDFGHTFELPGGSM